MKIKISKVKEKIKDVEDPKKTKLIKSSSFFKMMSNLENVGKKFITTGDLISYKMNKKDFLFFLFLISKKHEEVQYV